VYSILSVTLITVTNDVNGDAGGVIGRWLWKCLTLRR